MSEDNIYTCEYCDFENSDIEAVKRHYELDHIPSQGENEELMLGTGRMNLTGGTATITMPKTVLDLWDIEEHGKDMVWFTDGTRLFATKRKDVSVND